MTNKALLALADKVEKLEGGCRETDAEILATVFGVRHVTPSSGAPTNLANFSPVNCYTSSIDAAMTLVPEGWEWLEGHTSRSGGDYIGQKHVLRNIFQGDVVEAFGKNTACVIVAASLRALGDSNES